MAASVSWIYVAPVKGLAVVPRDEVELGPAGRFDDRRFHLIGAEGRLLNGKQLAPLVQIVPEWVEESGLLALSFPTGEVVSGVVQLGATVTTNFYGARDVEGRLVEGPWADAISTFVGRPLRLVQPVEPGGGRDRGRASVTLLSTASLDAMREAGGVDEPIDPRRFRMLLGVEGVDAHEEDAWIGRRVRLGQAEVEFVGNVGRCVVTTRDPETGARTIPTLDILAEYRHGVATTEPLPFGVWGRVTETGRVRLGDDVVPG